MEKGRERFFHPDRGTAAPDVSGRRKQLPDGNQIGFLVARNAGGSFQIDLVISRDDTDEMARPVTTKHERLENRSNIFAELFGHVSRGQMLLIHPIRDQFVGDFGSVEQTGRIGLFYFDVPMFHSAESRSGLGTTFGVLTQAGALRYEHLALANTFEFPLIETTGNITVTDCPILRSVLLPALTDAGSLEITGCPAIETLSFPKAERFDGDVSLATLPAIKDFGEFLPALKAISGDLSIDDLSSLEGVLDLSGCTFSPNSTLDLRLVAATRLTELRGGDFGGSLRIDASSLTPQPEAMPFGITGFKNLDTLRIAGFTHVSELSLPTESCDDLTIENCGSQAPFTLSLPNLVEVRGTLLCRNCGKAGEANSASFPRLKNVGRQLSFYVGASSFTVLEFPLLETVGNGEPVSDDPADDYALYTMPSGCAGEFILPSLQRVNGSMLVSTWNTSTDRAVAFRFPSLQSVAGEISVGHTAYKNRSVATLDFSALTAAGAIRIGNLSSVTDFSTFTQVLPRLSEQTWSVTDCSYNPTYQQMLDGETGAESK